MTKAELANKYLQSLGLLVIQGDERTAHEALLPFLIMDMEYTIFCRYIGQEKWRFGLARSIKAWREAYNAFNAKFFRTLSDEETAEALALMDDFSSCCENDIVRLLLATLETVPGEDLEKRRIFAACYLCWDLAQFAKTTHGQLYKDRTYIGRTLAGPAIAKSEMPTPELDKIIKNAANFGIEYAHLHGLTRATRTEKVGGLENSVCRRISEWLKK